MQVTLRDIYKSFGEVEVVETEVAGVFGGEGGEDGFAAAVVEKDLVADEDVAGLGGW